MGISSGINEGKVQAGGRHPKIYLFLLEILTIQVESECEIDPSENQARYASRIFCPSFSFDYHRASGWKCTPMFEPNAGLGGQQIP
jgi:hypothetical protein